MRVLLTGAAGQVGSEIVRLLEARSAERAHGRLEVVALDHARLELERRDQVLATVCAAEPDVVIHPAALTAVDACELDPDRAFAVNGLGTRHLAEASRLVGAHVVYLSTDYVFDGRSDCPYREWDATNPLSVYGRSKLAGEHELDPSWATVRTAWVVGLNGSNMAKTVLRVARESTGALRFVDDQRGSPTVAGDLAEKVVELALSRRPGCFHVTNQGETTWYGFARAVLEEAGLDADRVEPIATAELDPPRPAPRPSNSVLDNAALRLGGDELLPPWRDALGRLVRELSR